VSDHKVHIIDPQFSELFIENPIRDISLFEEEEDLILLVLQNSGEVMTYSLGSFSGEKSSVFNLLFGDDFNFTMSWVILTILGVILIYKFVPN
jgi:hypothetical protein